MAAAIRAAWGVGCLAVLGILAVALGLIPIPFLMDDGNRPPCAQLAPQVDVQRALTTHATFVQSIERVHGAHVGIAKPCGSEDRALVSIRVDNGAARSAVDALLQKGSGFGVPAEIVDN